MISGNQECSTMVIITHPLNTLKVEGLPSQASAAQDGSRNQDKTSDSCSANSQTFNGAHDRLAQEVSEAGTV